MSVIAWKDCYATGIGEFDAEHKDLVERVNSLYEAIRSKEAAERIKVIVPALKAYTLSHFAHEEQLLEEHQYPNLADHRKEHEDLKLKVGEFEDRLGEDDPQLPLQLFNFLREWLLHHIVEIDSQYGPFLRDRGVA